MKMILLNYYVGMDLEVKELLAAAGVRTFTRLPETEGRISRGELRENSHVWPGSNSTLFAVVEDGAADALMSEIESLNAKTHGEGVDAYLLDVVKSVTAA